jgi:hypothetical protein
MATNTDIERLNYYEGEYLGAADFEAEQEYHRDMRRRHNVGQHTWGIVSGLDLAQIPNGGTTASGQAEVDVVIQPGMAVDAFGREIILLGKAQLTEDLLAPYFDPNPAAPPKPMLVWIAFNQNLLAPSTDPCTKQNQSNAFGRVQESWRLVVAPPSGGPVNDAMVVDGTAVTIPAQPLPPPAVAPTPNPGDIVFPYDGSIPYQEFSTDDTSVDWYVLLGRVMWDPHNEVFVQQPAAWVAVNRLYAGSVTGAILSPTNTLTIQDRFAPTPLPTATTDPNYSGVSVDIAGTLSVERLLTAEQDLWLNEPGHLYFKNSAGQDGDTALRIGRVSNPAGGADLHIHIGDGNNYATTPQRLAIGFGKTDDASDTVVLDVRSDGNVEIPSNAPNGLLIPKGNLTFGASTRQMLNLWNLTYGIGVQNFTLYSRSDSDFCWFKGGAHADTRDTPGPGGSLSMMLDGNGALTTGGNLTTQGSLTVNGNRSYLLGVDGVSSHWIMNGGSIEGVNNALGFNSTSKQVAIGAAWTLDVQGGQNIFHVETRTLVATGAGTNPGPWSVNYAGIFSSVYTAFAVFQGFSIWPNDIGFTNYDNLKSTNNIVQHAFVRVNTFDVNSASGVAFCSESDAGEEADNPILFTVVIMGMPKI